MSKSSVRRPATAGAMARNAIDGAMGINSNSFYDCKSGLSISVILALTLSWIPYMGQIVAGYVGGRRSGSILRGLFVGALSCIIVFVVALLLNLGLTKLLFDSEYLSFIEALESTVPQLVMAMEQLSSYLSSNFVHITTDLSVSVPAQGYATIIAFSIIGGVFADQARKELRIIVSHTEDMNRPRPPRSVGAFLNGHDIGFQTYDDMTKVSVNTTCASMRKGSTEPEIQVQGVPVSSEPAKVELAIPEPVTTNVVSESVTVTPTENVPGHNVQKPVSVKGEIVQRKAVPDNANPSDDLEWF